FQVIGRLKLAQRLLDRDLPGDCCADIDRVRPVPDRPSRRLGKLPGVTEPPEHHVSIEQQVHPASVSIPKARAMSSGNSSKSSAIRTFPFHCPPWRGASLRLIGTRRTTGVPARAMITSSPCNARSTSFDNCDFAS